MHIEFLILFFTSIIIIHFLKHIGLIKTPIIEGLTSDSSCKNAENLSKKNASNLIYLNKELEKLKELDVKMQTLNNNVLQNNKAIAGISEQNEKKAKESEDQINNM
tara:strand:- start:147 stop:464 length:318 start_codon:yes stop_codon:yes gene_type:complete